MASRVRPAAATGAYTAQVADSVKALWARVEFFIHLFRAPAGCVGSRVLE